MRLTELLLAVLIWLVVLGVSGCGPEQARSAPRPVSVLLVTMDTTRADHLGCYGRSEASTPHLDRLAEESVRFEAAYTVCPLTLPSHASILTGLWPFRHRIRDNGTHSLRDEATTLTEVLAEQGYQTAAFVAAAVLAPRYGLAQGFEEYEAPTPSSVDGVIHTDISAEEVNAGALPWIERRDPDRPFFLWVHYFDPHSPYDPPPPFEVDAPRTRYDGEISRMDHAIGQLLDAVEPVDRTGGLITMVVADHGEGLGFGGEPTHGHLVYEPFVKVPLLIRLPDRAGAGQRRSDPVSVVDLLPTTLDAVGLPFPGPVDGRSLLDPEEDPERAVYFESYYSYFAHGWSPLAGVVTPRLKYIHSSVPELYHLDEDHQETDNLAGRLPDELRYAAGKLSALLQAEPVIADSQVQPTAEELESLRALGYVSGGSGSGLPDLFDLPPDLASPAERGDTIRRFHDATSAHPDWNLAQAIDELQDLTARDPKDTAVLAFLGTFLVQARRYEEARGPLQSLLQRRPGHSEAWGNLGAVHHAAREYEEAVRCYRKALSLDPTARAPLQNIIPVLEHLGRTRQAATYRKRLEELGGGR